MTTSAQPHDGLWAAGLARRTAGEPRCVDCREEPVEPTNAAELMLLWRRGKGFRRHRIYR